jgi:hypothetical protein
MDYIGGFITKNPVAPTDSAASGVWRLNQALQYTKAGTWPANVAAPISRSVRLRSSASAYLNRTLTTPTNNKIWTWSGWVKRGSVSNTSQGLFEAPSSGSTFGSIYFTSGDIINWYDASGGATVYILQTTQVFRDPSAWYHIVCAYDSTQATASDRQKIYVNGVQVTSFSTATYVAQNTNGRINSAVTHKLGTFDASSNYFDGYLTTINFIDGQALTPTSFGAFDAITGVWNPIVYTGTYGNNGFYLTFSDNSNNTATTLGKDSSGNGNNWTPNNISVTNVAAPNTNDSMVDSPTNYGVDTGVGGEVRGDYAVLSSVTGYAYTSSNGNLTAYGGNTNCYFSMPVTGKMYFEAYCSSTAGGGQMGFVKNASIATNTIGYNQAGYYGVNYAAGSVTYWVNGTNDGINHGTISGNTLKFAVDGATGKVWIGSGSTWFGSGDPANGTNPAFTLSLSTGDLIYPMVTSQSATYTFTINTGQQTFGNAAPSGFKAMCTQNMSTPTIANGAGYIAATLYTGNDPSTQSITNTVNGVSFQPDLVWAKSRSNAYTHVLVDSVRGVSTALFSNLTNAEVTESTRYVYAFNSNGFSVKEDTGTGSVNATSATYVGWQWKGGGTAVTNPNGSITSSVSANTTAGFSVVTYTGNGTSGATIGHGLGATASFIILKRRDGGSGYSWYVQHPTLGPTKALFLDSTNGAATSANYWNNTAPTSTVFSVGNDTSLNANTGTYVAYCWASVSGYSAFTTYTGNASGDGPFVYCGFRPRWLMIKRYDAAGDPWWLIDSTRSPYNQTTIALRPSGSNAEDNGGNANFDFLANGFKARTTGGGNGNESGATYIVAAFAENPFKIARAR